MPRTGRLVLPCLLTCLAPAFAADPPSDAERLKALEKQVADLKKEVGELRALMKLPPKPPTENKLFGNWGLDKPPDAKHAGVVALVVREDGTHTTVVQDDKGGNRRHEGKYKVVAKVVELGRFPEDDMYFHITSLDDKELVATVKVKGKPDHEVKLKRQ